jgi:hypothetical protein
MNFLIFFSKVKFYKAWALQDFWKGTNKPTSFNKLKDYKRKKNGIEKKFKVEHQH